jgi:hypothetical protein
MIDIDGRYSYSNIIRLSKSGIKKSGMVVSPNPVISNAMASLRVDAAAGGQAELKIIDMLGKVVLKQQNNVYEGANNLVLNNLNRLQPGTYILQMTTGSITEITRFTIAR